MQDKCASLKGNVNLLDGRFIEVAKQAEEKNYIKILIEGNALKRKSEDKRVEMKTLEGLIESLEDKMRTLKWIYIYIYIYRAKRKLYKQFLYFCLPQTEKWSNLPTCFVGTQEQMSWFKFIDSNFKVFYSLSDFRRIKF